MCDSVSVRELARAVLGRSPKQVRRVAVLSAYLDGGGTVGDPNCPVVTVAGYLATDDVWAQFEADWQAVLDKFQVASTSMKHVAHFRKGFEKWKGSEKQRAQFLSDLAGVIHKNDLEGFAFTLNMDHYREIDKRVRLTEAFPPYALIASFATAKIRDWQRRYRSNDSLLFLFELGDVGQGKFKHKMENDWQDSGIMKPIFMAKEWTENGIRKYCLPFQAADFLAYETNKMLSDWISKGKRTVRESVFRLSWIDGQIERHPTTQYLEGSHIMGIVRGWRVPPRKQR